MRTSFAGIDKVSFFCVAVAVYLLADSVLLRAILDHHRNLADIIRIMLEICVAISLLADSLPKLTKQNERRTRHLRRIGFVSLGVAIICFFVECALAFV